MGAPRNFTLVCLTVIGFNLGIVFVRQTRSFRDNPPLRPARPTEQVSTPAQVVEKPEVSAALPHDKVTEAPPSVQTSPELSLFCSECLFNPTGMRGVTCLDRAQYIANRYQGTLEDSKIAVMRLEPKNCKKSVDAQHLVDKDRQAKQVVSTNGTSPTYNASDYSEKLAQTLRPFDNVTTLAYHPEGGCFTSGFRNQGQAFVGFILKAIEFNHSQIYINSIQWNDQFGSFLKVRHDVLFDVVHWNSFYPELPRFVDHDPAIFPEISTRVGPRGRRINTWNVTGHPLHNATKPFAYGSTRNQVWNQYRFYTRDFKNGRINRHPADVLMLQGAYRPHPELQLIIDQFLEQLFRQGPPTGSNPAAAPLNSYIALHARIEPDMQQHPVCRDKKVTNLTDIFVMLEKQWPEPPASKLLVVTGRRELEKQGKDPNSPNKLAIHNLETLNTALTQGLWGGKVQLFEAGEEIIPPSTFSRYPSLSGGIVNYFLSVEADIFVGTEVSTFSNDIQATRFYRDKKQNYHYVPSGLQLTTPPDARGPPRFEC